MRGTASSLLWLGFWIAATAARADVVALHGGEWLSGAVVEQTEDDVTLDHPVLGRLVLPGDAVAEVRIGAEAAAGSEPLPAGAASASEPLEPVRPGLLGTGWLRGWDRSVELGVNGNRGNSETFDVRAGLEADVEDEERRWRFATGYSRSEDGQDTSGEDAFARLLRDWLLPGSPVFYFAHGRWDYDRFKAWDHRLATSGGVGYQILENERWNLRGRAGLGLTQTFGSEDDELTPEAVLGLELERVLGERHEVAAYTTFFPDLREAGEFRNLSGAHWEVGLAEPEALSFKLGFENVYETRIEGDADRNDLTYFGTLVYDF